MSIRVFLSFVLVSTFPLAADAADSLVVKGADGKVGPGQAASWKVDDEGVTFTLADGADGPGIAKLLSERLFNAKVSVGKGTLRVTGVPADALLDQLAGLSLSGGVDDPLGDLAGLGGTVVAMEAPEGGGSIRASNPKGSFPALSETHDPKERWQAEVVGVKRVAFPAVVLKLRVSRSAKAGALKSKLKKGKLVEAPVLLAGDAQGIDFASPINQRNLGAYYLNRGDKVTAHATKGADGKIAIDFIERR